MTLRLPSTTVAAELLELYERGGKDLKAAKATLQAQIAALARGGVVLLPVSVDPDAIAGPQELVDRALLSDLPDITTEGLAALRKGYRSACAKITAALKIAEGVRDDVMEARTAADPRRVDLVELTAQMIQLIGALENAPKDPEGQG